MTDKTPNTNNVVVAQPKSTLLAFLLALLFGPLGLLYVSVVGAVVLLLLGLFTAPVMGVFGVPFVWLASVVWAIFAAATSNGTPSNQ